MTPRSGSSTRTRASIATTDFFMPIVDDPFDFGRIAATNAISDVYAMGGSPIMALAILGMPLGKLSTEIVREILRRRQRRAARRPASRLPAGIRSIARSRSMGLAVIGVCAPDSKSGATAGRSPATCSSSPSRSGSASTPPRSREDALGQGGYEEMIATTTQLNKIGAELGRDETFTPSPT